VPDSDLPASPPRPGLAPKGGEIVLSVEDLHVTFPSEQGLVKAVDGVSFDVSQNEILGVVGESGSGKTVTVLAMMGLLPRTARLTGSVRFRDQELLGLPERELRHIRGQEIAMVFQDALAALNPVYKVGSQIAEAIKVHQPDISKHELHERVVGLLDIVGIPNPSDRAGQFPHEYSGGMRQRAMIAMAICNDPDVLIADEPTTALDVTIQAQVLEVLERVQDRTRSAIILITHDLGVVAGLADRVLVMYAGRPVEFGDVQTIFYRSEHPYTLGLLASLPRLDQDEPDVRLHRIKGQPPSLVFVPSGCAFHPRCDFARLPDPCSSDVPELRSIDDPAHVAACHFAEEVREKKPEDLRPVVGS